MAQTLAIVHGYEVDALFAEQRLVIELDGWEFHTGRVAFGDDRDRDADLLDFGYETVRITWERLHETPEREAARLEADPRASRAGARGVAGQLSSPRATARHASHRGHGGFHG